MKRIFIYLAIIGFGICMAGCKKATPAANTCNNGVKDGDETEIDCGGSCTACPPAGTLTATIAGNSFSATNIYWTQSGNSMSLRATKPTAAIALGLFFTYPVLNKSQVLTQASLNDNDNYIIQSGDTSSLTVTALDTVHKLMSGTFLFHATAPPSNHISVDSGTFTNVRYKQQ